MKKYTSSIYWICYFIVTFLIIYYYFLPYKSTVIYGDDLLVYNRYLSLGNSFSEKMNLSKAFDQFRPVRDIVMHFLVSLFKTNENSYFLFNILVLTISTFVFSRILNLFLKNNVLAFIFSLTSGLSRFSYYTATQTLNGGGLEGIALVFFLLSLYALLNVLSEKNYNARRIYRGLLLSVIYANVLIYTHERYVVMFAFIILVIIVFPRLSVIGAMRKGIIVMLAAISVIMPFYLKSVLGIRVFMGTANSDIEFTFSRVSTFFVDSVLSIIQINSGPSYLVGIPFSGLELDKKTTVFAVVACIVVILGVYTMQMLRAEMVRFIAYIRIRLSKARKAYSRKFSEKHNNFIIALLLIILFNLLLVPAIMTIRIELRFLQASFAILILAIAIAIKTIKLKSYNINYAVMIIFVVMCVLNDYNYVRAGTKNLFNTSTDNVAITFRNAIESGILIPSTTNLYIWEKRRNGDRENEVSWVTGFGGLFEAYQGKAKKYIFIDSLYQKTDTGYAYAFPNFNTNTDQIIFLNIENNGESFKYSITDLSGEFRKDSLKNFASSMASKQ